MPKIPGYQQDLQRETRSPYQTSDGSAAKIQNEALGKFANGLQDLGEGLQKQQVYEDLRRKEAANIQVSNFSYSMKGASDQIAHEAYGKAKPDGSDLTALYDQEMEKAANSQMKSITDPVAQQKAYGEYLQVKNERRSKLLDDSTRMFSEYATQSYENQLKVGSARTTANPNSFDKELNAYANNILNSGMTPDNKMKAINLGKTNMATGALNGLINAGDYGEAKAQLLNKFAGVFDAEKTQKWVDDIDKKKLENINTGIKAIEREEKLYSEALSARQDKNFTSMYAKITSMNTVDPYAPGKGATAEEASNQIDAMVVSGELKAPEASHLKRFLSKEQSDDNAQVSLDFYNKLATGADPDKVRAEVLSASADKVISPQTAQSLLGKLDYEKEKRAALQKAGRTKRTDPLKTVANDLISSYFKPIPGTPVNTEDKEREADAKAIAYSLQATGKYKNDPIGAARAALQKSIPGYVPANFKSEQDIKENAKALSIAKQKGQLTDLEYKTKLTELHKKQTDFKAGGHK
jgi:hypothetical protein